MKNIIKNSRALFVAIMLTSLVTSCEEDIEPPMLAVPSFQLDDEGEPIVGPNYADLSTRVWLDGGAPIEEVGVCWTIKQTDDEDEVQFPDKNGEYVALGTFSKDIAYGEIRSLPVLDTVYFARFYAINKAGDIGYSYPLKFSNESAGQ